MLAASSLYSQLSRASIDALKFYFKEKLENKDWHLVLVQEGFNSTLI